jgi:hypothetical protein
MQNKPTAAAPLEMKGAAAAADFQETILSLKTYFENFGFSSQDLTELEYLAAAEIPGISGTLSYIQGRFGNGYGFDSSRRIYVSYKLWKLGYLPGPFDYFKFWGKVKNARREIIRGRVSVAELKAGEFYEREKIAPSFSDYYGKSQYYQNYVEGQGFIYVEKSESMFCPLSGQFWHADNFTYFYSYRILDQHEKWGGPKLENPPHISETRGVSSYHVSEYAISSFPGGIIHVFNYGDIPADEMQHFGVVYVTDRDLYVVLDEYEESNEIYQHPNGNYYSVPFGIVCRPDEAVSEYHSGAGARNSEANKPVRFSRNSPILTGWEIEKEDFEVKCGITISDFQAALPNFRKERDGSLDGRAGFEFITPPLELSPKGIEKYLKERPVAVAHINANFSKKCGGHIHISRAGFTGRQLFDEIRGYLPLFYALFPGRADGGNSSYCKAKSAFDMVTDRQKYQAVNILNDRIEIRIFGAVKNLENLIWRAALLKKIFENPCSDCSEMYFNRLPGLISHLKKVYRTPEMLEKLLRRVEKYAWKYESITINPEMQPLAIAPGFGYNLILSREFIRVFRPATYKAVLKSWKCQYTFA